MGIKSVEVISDSLYSWGVKVMDYTYDGKDCDFQDLLIKICEMRAKVVESEIQPMSTRMSTRNKKLDQLGSALSIVADVQSFYKEDERGPWTSAGDLTDAALAGLEMIHADYSIEWQNGVRKLSMNKSQAEEAQQLLKTKIDSLNNYGSKDMTRLQSLVDKRDESYQTATSMMQSVADTRGNTIKNM